MQAISLICTCIYISAENDCCRLDSQNAQKTPAGKGYAFVGPQFTDAKYFGDGIGIAVRKGDKADLDKINAAIAAIRANGEYKKIQDKYFDFDIYGADPK